MSETPTTTALSSEAIKASLREFLHGRTNQDWEPETDLFTSGVVSSMFAMELVVYVEQTFDVMILGEDLALANFRTVRSMTDLVLRLKAGDNIA
jgi:methoxymalonate biosynthesis acyl carrier protein